jgi:hypothetical protein
MPLNKKRWFINEIYWMGMEWKPGEIKSDGISDTIALGEQIMR